MEIRIATRKQTVYACKHFHYAKRVPQAVYSYAIFNQGFFCGVIVFGYGANPQIAKPFNLWQGQVLELVRVALNGKQTCTSQALAMALKRLKKDNPQIKIIVSYADKDQDHKGIIYQATNWIYQGEFTKGAIKFYIRGKEVHKKTLFDRCKTGKIEEIKKIYKDDIEIGRGKGKYRYIFCFDKKERKKYLKNALPYPKE